MILLEREQAIREHREMWLWISKQVMKNRKIGEPININSLKKEYLSRNELYNLFVATGTQFYEHCFCCTFAQQVNSLQRSKITGAISCCYCPINWERERNGEIRLLCSSRIGLYSVVVRMSRDYTVNFIYRTARQSERMARRIAKICYKIATLPEKEGVINL